MRPVASKRSIFHWTNSCMSPTMYLFGGCIKGNTMNLLYTKDNEFTLILDNKEMIYISRVALANDIPVITVVATRVRQAMQEIEQEADTQGKES